MRDAELDQRLRERLARYEASVPVREPGRRLTGAGRSWQPAVLGFGAIATIAVLVVAVLMRGSPDDVGVSSPSSRPSASAADTPGPTPTAANPSPTATSVETALPSPGHAELEIVMQHGTPETLEYVVGFGDGSAGRIAAVNESGYASVPAVAPHVGNGAIYLELDDGSWQRVDTGATFTDVRLRQLLTPPGRPMVLYGHSADVEPPREITGAWTSTDGLNWAEANIEPTAGTIAAGNLGFVQGTVRQTERDAAVIELYWSDDAASWQLVHTVDADGTAAVFDVGAGEEGFVVTARARTDEPPLILASGDGRAWFQAPEQPAFTDDDLVLAVAPIGPDWVGAGWRSVSGEGTGIDLWFSTDGLHWEVAGSILPDDGLRGLGTRVMHPAHLTWSDGRLFLSGAFATEGNETRPVGVWTSTDGRTWDRLDLGGPAEVRVVDRSACCFWLGGRLGSDTGEAAIWRWAPFAP